MKYEYKSKTFGQLETLAGRLLSHHKNRVKDHQVDMEGILEDMGITLLPRPNLKREKAIDAFLPRDKNYILIDEEYGSDLPYFRVIIAEEISHRLLEPELWEKGVPPGANIYELDKQIYDEIEGDAYRLGLAIVMPGKSYTDLYNLHLEEAHKLYPENHHDDKIKMSIDKLSNDFEVTFNSVATRGNHLGLFKASGFIQKKQLPGAVIL